MKLNDKSATIMEFRKEIETFVIERKWKEYHNPKDLAIAINVESAELLENFLFLKEKLINESKIEDIKQEIADVFIYLMSMVNAMNLDLTEIFYQKMEKNRKKYPVDEFHDGNYNKK